MWRKIFISAICLCALMGCDGAGKEQQEQELKQKQEQELKQKQEQELKEKLKREYELKLQALSSNISALEQQKRLLNEQLVGREQKISSLEAQLTAATGELNTYIVHTEAYIMNHKIATSCLAAANVSLSSDNQFSQKSKELAQGYSILCLGLLLKGGFLEEVIEVGDKLIQADHNVKNLRSQIKELQTQITTEKEAASNERAEFESLSSKIQGLQSEMAQLQASSSQGK